MPSVAFQGLSPQFEAFSPHPITFHPRADWLRYSGLFATLELPLPRAVSADQPPGPCVAHFQRVAPVQQWLVDRLAA